MLLNLFHRQSQTKVLAGIELIDSGELVKLMKSGRFGFDWQAEVQNEIYTLALEEKQEVVGLMALKDIPAELRLEIMLLETSVENVGKSKVFEGIAGALIAFACRIAFLKGYQGFVSLTPKTDRITYYQQAYGFQSYGRQLALEGETALSLIKKYLENE